MSKSCLSWTHSNPSFRLLSAACPPCETPQDPMPWNTSFIPLTWFHHQSIPLHRPFSKAEPPLGPELWLCGLCGTSSSSCNGVRNPYNRNKPRVLLYLSWIWARFRSGPVPQHSPRGCKISLPSRAHSAVNPLGKHGSEKSQGRNSVFILIPEGLEATVNMLSHAGWLSRLRPLLPHDFVYNSVISDEPPPPSCAPTAAFV